MHNKRKRKRKINKLIKCWDRRIERYFRYKNLGIEWNNGGESSSSYYEGLAIGTRWAREELKSVLKIK